ncbi:MULTISPECIES: hypothetical protein [Bacillus cereus group]|uniref:Uncharacterized protein n=1 Tax=Bacillus thuringiensis TaxID=1428 RepID=A0A9X6WT23_BACTU|nr:MULTISPECIES: hypothetical protein [Bacillus cereus group]PFJ42760.1 hypothetical protein COJ15_05310 [Bacillus thuringiensis]PGP21072.1 hypothetical protein COA01_16165 [Bacillus cereus]
MKEALTVIKVATLEELVDRYEYGSKFAAAYVEELNTYAVAVAYKSTQSSNQEESVTKTGKSLNDTLSQIGNENHYAMSVAYGSSHTEYSGESAVKKGGSLKSIISRGKGSNRIDYHIYLVHNKQIEMYWLGGDIFDSFGYCYALNLMDKTVKTNSLNPKDIVRAKDYVKDKVIA